MQSRDSYNYRTHSNLWNGQKQLNHVMHTKPELHCQATESVLTLSLDIFTQCKYGECQHEISLVIIMDKVCMLIPIVGLEGGISCRGEKPPCKGLGFCVTFEAILTLYADYTNRGSLDRLIASQVRSCQSNLMLLSLIDPNFVRLNSKVITVYCCVQNYKLNMS